MSPTEGCMVVDTQAPRGRAQAGALAHGRCMAEPEVAAAQPCQRCPGERIAGPQASGAAVELQTRGLPPALQPPAIAMRAGRRAECRSVEGREHQTLIRGSRQFPPESAALPAGQAIDRRQRALEGHFGHQPLHTPCSDRNTLPGLRKAQANNQRGRQRGPLRIARRVRGDCGCCVPLSDRQAVRFAGRLACISPDFGGPCAAPDSEQLTAAAQARSLRRGGRAAAGRPLAGDTA